MASLTITVPDAYVARIRAAFGKGGQSATIAELQEFIKGQIRARVIQYETAKASEQKHEQIATELW